MSHPELAKKCAEVATEEAKKANQNGTFGVGGLIIANNGNILKIIENRVIEGKKVNDPTAHVERQLVDWYFEQKATTELPSPKNTTIIKSKMAVVTMSKMRDKTLKSCAAASARSTWTEVCRSTLLWRA